MPHWLIDGMIYLGSLLMVYNIYGFVRYARSMQEHTREKRKTPSCTFRLCCWYCSCWVIWP